MMKIAEKNSYSTSVRRNRRCSGNYCWQPYFPHIHNCTYS